jgi:hypothetical protein
MSISMLTTRDGAAGGDVPHPLWRIRVERYHRMIQAGVLRADDPVELLATGSRTAEKPAASALPLT